MADAVLKRLKEFFTGNAGVKTVAGDAVLTAELLLLFRVILADGRIEEAELAAFKAICRDSFGIAEDDVDEVIDYLNDAGYETTGRQALAMFESMGAERKAELVRHMAAIAKADNDVDAKELDIVRKAAIALGLAQ